MILDLSTGLVRGASVGQTEREACGRAIATALTVPAGPLPPTRPARIWCSPGHGRDVTAELGRLGNQGALAVTEVAPLAEAEDVFDSFVGHMAGRGQPDQFPTPQDWRLLADHCRAFWQAHPWSRWSDIDRLDLVTKVDGVAVRHVAIVLGQEGIQHGLALYPGAVVPEPPPDPKPGDHISMPAGTLLFWLDPRDELPAEFASKAARYGWPEDAELWPTWLATGPGGPLDIDRAQARRITVAVTAVLAHDQGRTRGGDASDGTVVLADGHPATYSIR